MELTGKQRRRLRGIAQGLKPLVRIGKAGVTDGLIDAVDRALSDHELVKIRFLEHKTERKELTKAIAEKTRGHIVGIIGNTATLYRENPYRVKRKK